MTTETLANLGAVIGIIIVTAMGIFITKATNEMYKDPDVEKKA